MRELTEELFRYSVIAVTADELHFEPLYLNNILEESPAGSFGMLNKHGIVPNIEISERQIIRTLDRQALRRIFDNILSNVAKYSDGDLTVRLLSDGTV